MLIVTWPQFNLDEKQLADLYVWLVHQYPYEEDPDRSNGISYSITTRDNIVSLKSRVLTQLRERGTLEACTEIQRLIQELPDITWLGKILIDAQVNMRRKTWQPPTPEEFLQFVNKQQLNQFQGVTNVTNFNFDQRGATIGVNVANKDSNIKFIQHARQNINISEQDLAESAKKIKALLNQLAQDYPITTEQQQQTFIQKFLEQVESTPDLIQVFLAGGIEGLKILCPPVGIPIEVLRRLYEVVKERNNKA
ncbi:hypothetical protein AWQ23_13525 [Picosynechococcus sp. PCC 73109]|nr:hypothetical protein AWQ23_13525 [Picosynechococcus sp. PCC 73109]